MSLADIIALAGAGMAGYTRGQSIKRERDKEDAQAQWEQEQRDQTRAQWKRDQQLRDDLGAAAAPVTMTQSGGRPDTMDDRDVGQPGEAPVAPNTFTVDGKSFGEQGQAQKAVATSNSVPGQMGRIANAYMKNGQAGMATQVRASAMQAEASQLGLDETHARMANEMFDRGLTPLGSHDDIANYVTNSRGDGQGGALKVKAVVSPDGKTVTYNTVSDDGTLTPTGQTYDNTPSGVMLAKSWLSKTTPLQQKITALHQQHEDERQAANDAAQQKFRDAQLAIEKTRANAELHHYLSMEGIANARGPKAASAFTKMDEDTKLQYQGLVKGEQEINAKIDDGIAKGTLDPTQPGFAMLEQKRIQARQARLGFEMRNGLIDPADVAAGITNGEQDPAKITTAVQQAYSIGGKEFGDKVKATVQPTLDALIAAGAKKDPKATTGTPTAKAGTPAPTTAPSREQQIAEIQQRLAADDKLTEGGKSFLDGGMGRAIQQGVMPLTWGDRRQLEQRLAQLKKGAN